MPVAIPSEAPTVFIRRAAYESSGLTRRAIDERLGLTPDEFRVDGDLIVVGPIYGAESLTQFLAELESSGLVYFDDFFELTGNWPAWLRLFASSQ
jgi:hypothetical protein